MALETIDSIINTNKSVVIANNDDAFILILLLSAKP